MPPYQTSSGLPTRGLVFAELIEAMRQVETCCALLAHIHQTEASAKDKVLAMAWLSIAELMRKLVIKVTALGQGQLN